MNRAHPLSSPSQKGGATRQPTMFEPEDMCDPRVTLPPWGGGGHVLTRADSHSMGIPSGMAFCPNGTRAASHMQLMHKNQLARWYIPVMGLVQMGPGHRAHPKDGNDFLVFLPLFSAPPILPA